MLESEDESIVEVINPQYGAIGEDNVRDITLSPYLPSMIMRFHPDEPYLPALVDGKMTCTYNVGTFSFHGKEYTKIEYAFNYEANGAIGCGYQCFPKSECLGYHYGDRERMMFLLGDDQQSVEWVWFNCHSPGQGLWRRWSDCERVNSGNTLMVYSARASHANYPDGQTWIRAACFANDLCDDGPAFEVVVSGTHTDTVLPKQASITWWQRFWLCCYASYLRNDTP